MGRLKFEVRYPNGHRDVAVVEGERALVGSSAHSDVRLPIDQAAYEQLVIEVSGGSVRAEARAELPVATINGMRLTASPVARDSALGVGDIRIFVEYLRDASDGEATTSKDKKETSPLVRVALLIAVPVAGYLFFLEPDAPFSAPPAEAPSLFTTAPAACAQATAQEALAAADEKMDQAMGKRERMPFAPKEGLSAVGLFEGAAACFKAGSSSALADQAATTAEALKVAITRDFRTRRIRLSRMLKLEDYELAQRDVRVLDAMTEGKQGPFVNWLGRVKANLKSKGIK